MDSNHIEMIDNWDNHWQELSKKIYFKTPAILYRWDCIFKLLSLRTETNKTLIDFGCGTGYLIEYLKSKNPSLNYIGIDNSKTGLDVARTEIQDVSFFQLNLGSDDVNKNNLGLHQKADYAVCSEVLEHLDYPVEFLRNIKDFMKPGSKMVITVPGGPMGEFDRLIGHRKHYTKEILSKEIEESGFRLDKIVCAGFPFHNIYRLLMILKAGKLYKNTQTEDISESKLINIAMRIFNFLFKFNLFNSRFGWTIVARVTL